MLGMVSTRLWFVILYFYEYIQLVANEDPSVFLLLRIFYKLEP